MAHRIEGSGTGQENVGKGELLCQKVTDGVGLGQVAFE